MPSGADTVFMQEDCGLTGSGDGAAGAEAGSNRRLAARKDEGSVALYAARRLAAADLSMAAEWDAPCGPARVRVAIFSTAKRSSNRARRAPAALRCEPRDFARTDVTRRANQRSRHLRAIREASARLTERRRARKGSLGVSPGEADT